MSVHIMYPHQSVVKPSPAPSRRGTDGSLLGHTPNGWPHLSSTTGACLCDAKCCLGPDGCRCRSCSGAGHANCRNAKYLGAS